MHHYILHNKKLVFFADIGAWTQKKKKTAPVPKSNIQYESSNFNLSLIMDDPFIKGWTNESNEAWKDFSEGGNSELLHTIAWGGNHWRWRSFLLLRLLFLTFFQPLPPAVGSVVSTEYLESQGYESIPMADGSGHWVYLEVYHDLHCLSYLRKVLYNSTNGLITDDSDPWMKYHIREPPYFFNTHPLGESVESRVVKSKMW